MEICLSRRESAFPGEDPFFIDDDPTTMQPSSVLLSKEKWRELGQPERLVVLVKNADCTDTAGIPVITGEFEVVERIDHEHVVRPVPHSRQR